MNDQVLLHFFPSTEGIIVEPFGNGHINDTYRVTDKASSKIYILQRINTNVFTNPQGLIANHLKLQEFQEHNPSEIELPVLEKTLDGEYLVLDSENNAWRLMNFIHDSESIELVTDANQAFEAGKGYGWFVKNFSALNSAEFVEAIKDFHKLSFRIWQLNEAIKNDKSERVASVKDLLKFYKDLQPQLSEIEQLINSGEIPTRVVHNDTKINNALFRNDKVCAVIDLDTVGPGILFYDFGDALRTLASTANEDEKDLSKVSFNIDSFKNFAKGYIGQVAKILTPKEKEFLHLSPILMTFIMGIRFLADYLNGDVYYKTNYPEHNLVRSKVQRKLIESIQAQEAAMIAVIQNN